MHQKLQNVIAALSAAKASTNCTDMATYLESLGFYIRGGKSAGHKLFFHDGLSAFKVASYDCGHAKNQDVKLPYVVNVLRVLRQHQDEISSYLDGLDKKEQGEGR